MKRIQNTLYVTTQGAYLARKRETVTVKIDGKVKLRVPVHTLGGIVCFGNIACSPFLLGLCAERGVGVSFLTRTGRFLARVEGARSGNVLLRREQFRVADNPDRASDIARRLICGKVANCRTSLKRHLRDNPGSEARENVVRVVDRLSRILVILAEPLAVDIARGHEGEASRLYFSALDHLVLKQKEDFFFTSRSRRPPTDNLNSLLSFLYTLLVHDARSACESVGLDPQVGYLHQERPGRPSLALDLMEEFRPVLADRLALALVNRQQVRATGFKKTVSGAVEMDDKTRRQVLEAYQKRKTDGVKHPFLEKSVPMGLMLEVQARLMARHLREDLDAYPPFFWK